jgi:hypothetical protein
VGYNWLEAIAIVAVGSTLWHLGIDR